MRACDPAADVSELLCDVWQGYVPQHQRCGRKADASRCISDGVISTETLLSLLCLSSVFFRCALCFSPSILMMKLSLSSEVTRLFGPELWNLMGILFTSLFFYRQKKHIVISEWKTKSESPLSYFMAGKLQTKCLYNTGAIAVNITLDYKVTAQHLNQNTCVLD